MSAQKIGFLISGLILLGVGGVIVVALWPQGIGAPTSATTDPGKLDKIIVKSDGSDLVPPATGTGALDLYETAFKTLIKDQDYRDFHSICDDIRNTPEPEKSATYKPIIDLLVSAAGKGMDDGDLVLQSVPINVKSDLPSRELIYAMGQLLTKAAASTAADKSYDQAEKYYKAALVMGQRLWKNGAFVMYRSAGLAIMSEAADGLNQLYGDQMNDNTKAEAIKAIAQQIDQASAVWSDKEKIIRTENPNPGDLVNLAKNDADRCWRIEGVMWLGFAKWRFSGKQQAAIIRFLQSDQGSSDPIYAEKAKESLDFSDADVHDIRTE